MSLVSKSTLSMEEIQKFINSVWWYHSVEILPGIITPCICTGSGIPYNTNWVLSFIQKFIPNLTGKRILEIGKWDGSVAYKLKSHGYDVVASDIQDRQKTSFNVIQKNYRIKCSLCKMQCL
ncbi:MAG: hypothetical protein QXS69_03005 [Candidatus Aenigmatarchaeota archaeon]